MTAKTVLQGKKSVHLASDNLSLHIAKMLSTTYCQSKQANVPSKQLSNGIENLGHLSGKPVNLSIREAIFNKLLLYNET
jgi:hypothetical protein